MMRDIQVIEAETHPFHEMNLLFCGFERCRSGHEYGPSIRDHDILHFVHSGKGVLEINGETFPVSPKQGFYIRAGDRHRYQAESEQPWNYTWIAFRGTYECEILAKFIKVSKSPVFNYASYLNLHGLLKLMMKIDKSQPNPELQLLGNFMLILSELNNRKQCQPMNECLVEQAVRYIGDHAHQPLLIGELAKEIGVSRSYLFQLFKQYKGMSPQDYLMDFRMKRAQELLLQSKDSITEVASRVGYEDVMLFSKMFKRKRGCTPSSFRKANSNSL
jgi:AraC-like DNA-binding protein